MMTTLLRIFLVFVVGTRVNCARKTDDDDLKSIFLRLYNGNNIGETFIDAPLDIVTLTISKHTDPKKPTVVYIHGYTGSTDSEDTKAIVTAYLERKDHNVIAADWRQLAGEDYVTVVISAKSVGRALALALDAMIEKGLDPKRIHVVRHSMGAQVASHLGREMTFELGRITGLDPAGPLIEQSLTKYDAEFVDTIHTDMFHYGHGQSSGSVSFFPNGGIGVQPGCPKSHKVGSHEDFCSHHRSWHYYAEALRDERSFVGTECDNYIRYAHGDCNKNVKIPMGYATPTDSKGFFYLRTRNETPFGMQMDGAIAQSKYTIH